MNTQDEQILTVLLHLFLFLAIVVLGFALTFGGASGPARLARSAGGLFMSLVAGICRGLIILILLVIAYELVANETGKFAQHVRSLSVQIRHLMP